MSEILERVEDKAQALRVMVDDLVHQLIEEPDSAGPADDHKVVSLNRKVRARRSRTLRDR